MLPMQVQGPVNQFFSGNGSVVFDSLPGNIEQDKEEAQFVGAGLLPPPYHFQHAFYGAYPGQESRIHCSRKIT